MDAEHAEHAEQAGQAKRVSKDVGTGGGTWNADARTAFLRGVRLFRGMDDATLAAAAGRFRVRHFADGEFVFLAGMRAGSVNLLGSGRVKVVRETEEGREVILRFIQPGDLFGGAGGWGEAEYPASAVAQGQTVVLQLPAREFDALVAESPAFARAVIGELGRRLREAENRIRELQTERAEQRIARALLRLANKTGVKTAAGIEIGVRLSRQDLAELSGTTLSTASRTLSAWDRQGVIVAGRERVTIARPHALVAIAEELGRPPPDE